MSSEFNNFNIDKKNIIAFDDSNKQKIFEEIVNTYETKLINVVNKIISDLETSRDIVQDVFLTFYEKGDSFEGRSSIYTWLYKVATNKSIDYVRRSVREKRYKTSIFHMDNVIENSHDERVHQKMIVAQALSRLEEKFRMPLILAEYDNMSYAQIAQVLSIEINTVRTRIFRARKKMLSILKKQGVKL